jgi:hypothetical protein
MNQLVRTGPDMKWHLREHAETRVAYELNGTTVPIFLQYLHDWHHDDHQCGRPLALVLRSSVAKDTTQADNLQGVDFDNHIQAVRAYVSSIRFLYPAVTLFWRSASLRLHRVDARCR